MMRQRDRQQQVQTYQGRPLVRPDDEVVDQGLGFDVVTVMGRRQLLRALGVGAAALGLAACGSGNEAATTSTAATRTSDSAAATGTGEIPDETAGPYPGDGSNGPDVLEQSGIVRSDLRSSFGESSGTADGVPMTLELTISDLANGGAAFAGVTVYVWHCDRSGSYSLYSDGITDQNYLRGVQIADDAGAVRFTSIFPACYSGRWPHIHFEVYPDQDSITDAANAIATSQVALPKDVCDLVYAESGYETSVSNLAEITLQSDNVFGDEGGDTQLGTVTGDVAGGYAVSLHVGVDTGTAPTGGGTAGGSDGAPGGSPPAGMGGSPPTGEAGPGGGGTPRGGNGGTPPSGGPNGAAPDGAPSAVATTG